MVVCGSADEEPFKFASAESRFCTVIVSVFYFFSILLQSFSDGLLFRFALGFVRKPSNLDWTVLWGLGVGGPLTLLSSMVFVGSG